MSEIVLPGAGDEGFDEDLEARLVALIVGEASEFEVEAMERLMAKRPEVADLKHGLEVVHGLVEGAVESEHAQDAEWKLSPERRTHVMQSLGIGNGGNGPSEEPNGNGNGEAKEARIRRAGRKVIWAAAACLVANLVIFALLVGTGTRARMSDSRSAEQPTELAYDSISSQRGGDAGSPETSKKEKAPPPRSLTVPQRIPSPIQPASKSSESERFAMSLRGGTERRAQSALAKLRENLGTGATDERGTAAERQAGRKIMEDALSELSGDELFVGGGTVAETKKVEVAGNARAAKEADMDAAIAELDSLDPGSSPEARAKIEKQLDLAKQKLRSFDGRAPAGTPAPSAAPLGGPEAAEPDPFSVGDGDETGEGVPALPAITSGNRVPVPASVPAREGEGYGGGGGDNFGGAVAGGRSPAAASTPEAEPEPDSPKILSITGLWREDEIVSEKPPAEKARPLGEGEHVSAVGKDGTAILSREVVRRSGNAEQAEQLLKEGRDAYAKGEYEKAVQNYTKSLNSLPGGSANEERRRVMEQHLADGTVALSQAYRRTGRYNEAREKLEGVLTVDPNNLRARQELDYLDGPIRTNPGLTFEHTQNVDKVRRHLYTAEGYKNLGLYDEAIREYRDTLRTDPHNTAARRGMESIHKLKSDHYRSSYDEGRARLLSQVDQAWQMTVPPPVTGGRALSRSRRGAPLAGSEGISEKMKEIVIPELNLENTTVDEAMEILRQKVEELDDVELDPKKKGINFVVRKPRLQGGTGGAADEELDAEGGLGALDPGQARVKELKLKNVPVQTALQYIADQARLRYKVDEHAVTLLPIGSGEGDDVLTRKWKVPPTFVTDIESGAEGGDAEADPFGGDDTGLGGGSLRPRRPLIDILKDAGIDFPPGSSAQFIPSTSTLIVSNTPSNLDLVDQLSESILGGGPDPNYREIDPNLFRRFDDPKAEKTEETWQRLRYVRVPDLELRDVTVAEALNVLKAKAQVPGIELRAQGQFEWGLGERGVSKVDPRSIRIPALKLQDVRLGTALYQVANQAGLDLEVSGEEVILKPQEGTGRMVTLTWHVDPKVMQGLREPQDYSSGEPDPFGDDESASNEVPASELIRPSRPLIDELKDAGIDFPPGSTIRYLPETSTLIVKNNPENLDLVDQLFATVAMGMSEQVTREEEIKESVETKVTDEPFSTFSLHISDVSFKLAKATLDKGEWPAAGQIRVEEFVNAFDYDDPTPRMAEKVSCQLEQAAHPFMQQRNLLRISMRTAALGRAGGTPLRLTVLLDNSGSMERADRAESVQRAFDLLTAQMNAADAITLISFSRTPRLLADRIPGNEARDLSKLVASIPSEGGTNLEEALRLGLSKAREQKVEGGINRVILLTDGAANLGNAKPVDLARLVEAMREQGIAFDACGVGAEGLNDEILESLTRKGDGRYYFLDRPEDADAGFARQIAGALRPAAKNVKVQVAFNPRRVGYYKLYGFEKHLLEKEDFRDDTVDAAEMAAEEAGNAVYHLEVRPDGEGDLGTVSVRFQDTTTGRMVERKWTIPYEPAAPGLSEATPSMKLAGSAALFGEKLNGSPVGERVRLADLVKLVGPLTSDYPGSPRVQELLEMVAKARGLGE